MKTPLLPNRPYLLQAYYDWLTDNQLTPHLVVDATVEGTQVPRQYVKDGQIVLNIAGGAVVSLELGKESVEFNACFGGVPQQVVLPMASIIAIYARENSAGVVFEMEEAYSHHDELLSDDSISDEQPKVSDEPKKSKAHLKVIK